MVPCWSFPTTVSAILAEAEELEPIDQDEIQALELILREGQDDDSDIFHDEPCDSEIEEFEAWTLYV